MVMMKMNTAVGWPVSSWKKGYIYINTSSVMLMCQPAGKRGKLFN